MAVVLILISLVPPTFSQNTPSDSNLKFTQIGKSQGLANPKVTDLFQDSYGFVWIGTEYGLYRFDGYECKPFFTQPGDTTSLSANHITYGAFVEDADSNLWVATYLGGLNHFDRRSEKFTRYQARQNDVNWLNQNSINAITSDGKGGIWIATVGRGLNHLNPHSEKKFKWYWDEKSNADTLTGDGTLVTLLLDKKGLLWIGTGKGLCRFDPTNESFERFFPNPNDPNSLSSDFVTSILEDRKGRVWIASKDGLNLWENGRFKHYLPNDQIPATLGNYNYLMHLFEDSEGNLWAGSVAGLIRLEVEGNDVRFTPVLNDPSNPNSIAKGTIHAIMEDRAGNLWFGTKDGVSILNKAAARLADQRFSALNAEFKSIATSEGFVCAVQVGEKIWFGNDLGIFVYEMGKVPRRILNTKVKSLFLDKKGRVYVGTVEVSTGFFVMDGSTERVLAEYERNSKNVDNPEKFKGARIEAFAEDKNGYIWIGSKGILTRFDPNRHLFRGFYNSDGLANSTIRDLLVDKKGNLWVATDDGIDRLDAIELNKPFDAPLRFHHFQYSAIDPNTLSSNLVYCLLESIDGSIWAGTDIGLNRLDVSGKWKRFFTADGLADNKISDLVEENDKNLWVCTANNGISKYDGNRFVHFSTANGLFSDIFNAKASFKMKDGTLVFPTPEGVNAFRPKDLMTPEKAKPPLYFTDFQVFNKPVAMGGANGLLKEAVYMMPDITLNFSQKVFSFKIAALDFAQPGKQLYRYRVTGLGTDTTWIELQNQRVITLSNLLPGKHLLYVQASSDGYDWYSTSKPMHITIRPPWWIAWWAIVLYLTLISTTIYTLYRFRLQKKLADAESYRLQELDNVKTHIYTNITHEFRTPLTIILGEASQLEKQASESLKNGLNTIRRNGRQLLNLVNQMLDLAKLEGGTLPLNLTQGDVVVFLKYLLESFQSLAASKQIRLQFEAPFESFLMDYDAERLRQILSNLLSNAIKFTPEGGEVWLRLGTATLENRPTLTLSVSDTGPGIPPENLPFIFDRFYQVDDSMTRQMDGTGIGLTLTKELVKLLGGDIIVQSEPGNGTTFTVTFPVTRKAALVPVEPMSNEDMVLFQTPSFPIASKHLNQASSKRNLPSLLIIEDNADVVHYVTAVLQSSYRLFTAPNGKLGLEMAQQEVPDLIISDVMMPEMDGYEVCRALKTDVRTSHIPIVLLTAKADFESRMEGLEGGAEAYLSKPFEEQELMLVLRKLLENRELLRQHFTSGTFIVNHDRAGLRANSRDEQFLEDVLKMVETHLDDYGLTAESLADLLHVSYNSLFKKVKALTGMGVTEYVRHIRIHRAAQILLEKTEHSVSHVSLEVGFSNLNFFSREFKKVMKQGPKDWRKHN